LVDVSLSGIGGVYSWEDEGEGRSCNEDVSGSNALHKELAYLFEKDAHKNDEMLSLDFVLDPLAMEILILAQGLISNEAVEVM
jgi:hypothetical protein